MKYIYQTQNTCSQEIQFDINGDVITNVEFAGGCNGNLKAIPNLIDGWKVEEIAEKCGGIMCGRRPTSCTDQLALAVRKAYQETQLKQ